MLVKDLSVSSNRAFGGLAPRVFGDLSLATELRNPQTPHLWSFKHQVAYSNDLHAWGIMEGMLNAWALAF